MLLAEQPWIFLFFVYWAGCIFFTRKASRAEWAGWFVHTSIVASTLTLSMFFVACLMRMGSTHQSRTEYSALLMIASVLLDVIGITTFFFMILKKKAHAVLAYPYLLLRKGEAFADSYMDSLYPGKKE